jgi:hypothetical protein
VEDDTFSVVGESEFDEKTQLSVWVRTILVTMVFGGIHCIGWSFDFPSHTEQLLWRISSIAITGIPLGIVVIAFIGVILDLARFGDLFRILFVLLCLLYIPPLYILCRVLLLVMSLTTLRSLPSTAFQTVRWTTFLPHV